MPRARRCCRPGPASRPCAAASARCSTRATSIPYVSRRGDWLYNFWHDADQPARPVAAHHAGRIPQGRSRPGRRCSTSTRWAAPKARTGSGPAPPAWARTTGAAWCQLSRGGADATVVREFDTVAKALRRRRLRAARGQERASTGSTPTRVFVGTDFGPGSLTDSGYPRVIKRWRRGQPLADAVTVFEARAERRRGLRVAWTTRRASSARCSAARIDFYSSEQFLLQGDAGCVPHRQARRRAAELLARARADRAAQRLDASAARPWPRGSLLVGRRGGLPEGRAQLQALFTPTPTRSLAGYTRHAQPRCC